MDKYLIEVPHEPNKKACIDAIRIFLESGSHFLAQADWGCEDGIHKAWMILEVNSREEAVRILPAALRPKAKIIKLRRFTQQDVDAYHSKN